MSSRPRRNGAISPARSRRQAYLPRLGAAGLLTDPERIRLATHVGLRGDDDAVTWTIESKVVAKSRRGFGIVLNVTRRRIAVRGPDSELVTLTATRPAAQRYSPWLGYAKRRIEMAFKSRP